MGPYGGGRTDKSKAQSQHSLGMPLELGHGQVQASHPQGRRSSTLPTAASLCPGPAVAPGPGGCSFPAGWVTGRSSGPTGDMKGGVSTRETLKPWVSQIPRASAAPALGTDLHDLEPLKGTEAHPTLQRAHRSPGHCPSLSAPSLETILLPFILHQPAPWLWFALDAAANASLLL